MKPSLQFNPVQVTGEQIAYAALEYRKLNYRVGSTYVWQTGGQWFGETNCYGLLLLAAKDVGLLPSDFDVNLTPDTFKQRPAKTLWEIVHLNFDPVSVDDLQYGDLLLMHYYGPQDAPHHVAVCVPPPPHYQRDREAWLLHAVDKGFVEWVPVDPLVKTHIKSVWRVKNLSKEVGTDG